jgi:hypothetical protein
MAYTKTQWKDQVVENPRTYSMRDNGDNTVTLLDAFGDVTELGTPVNAANMNKIENELYNLDAAVATKQATVTGAATTITGSNLTANRALVSNGSGKVAVSAVTSTELGYLDGVTSAIQTQIDGKQATITGAATSVTSSNLTASRALGSNSNGKIAVANTTVTELNYVHGVTSNIQTQLNAKQSSSDVSTAISNMLKALYPVGSIYIGTQDTCPLASLISGSTWSLVAKDRALWGKGNNTSANTNISAGLPNITGTFIANKDWYSGTKSSGAFTYAEESTSIPGGLNSGAVAKYTLNASRSSSIYGNSSTVQPPAYVVNVWRRTK